MRTADQGTTTENKVPDQSDSLNTHAEVYTLIEAHGIPQALYRSM